MVRTWAVVFLAGFSAALFVAPTTEIGAHTQHALTHQFPKLGAPNTDGLSLPPTVTITTASAMAASRCRRRTRGQSGSGDSNAQKLCSKVTESVGHEQNHDGYGSDEERSDTCANHGGHLL